MFWRSASLYFIYLIIFLSVCACVRERLFSSYRICSRACEWVFFFFTPSQKVFPSCFDSTRPQRWPFQTGIPSVIVAVVWRRSPVHCWLKWSPVVFLRGGRRAECQQNSHTSQMAWPSPTNTSQRVVGCISPELSGFLEILCSFYFSSTNPNFHSHLSSQPVIPDL